MGDDVKEVTPGNKREVSMMQNHSNGWKPRLRTAVAKSLVVLSGTSFVHDIDLSHPFVKVIRRPLPVARSFVVSYIFIALEGHSYP